MKAPLILEIRGNSLDYGHLENHLPDILKLYQPRQQAMLNAWGNYFPRSFHWTKPGGGMFIWVAGPIGFAMEKCYRKSIERNVAFVPGIFFLPTRNKALKPCSLISP